MKVLKDFYDFLLENKLNLELTIGISERLEKLLEKVDHPISKSFLDLSNDNIKSDKITLIDYDDKDYSKFTYIIPLKIADIVKKYTKKDKEGSIEYLKRTDSEIGKFVDLSRRTKQLWEEMRVSTSISKVVEKTFPGKYDASKGEDSRESFMNLVISKRNEIENNVFINFKIVDGYDIIRYYNEKSYDNSNDSGKLFDSCMKYDRCSDYLEFYADNKGVKMVVLFSSENTDKIIGRALLWDIEYIDGKKVDRKFMDRIYTVNEYDVELFKEYAKKNNWLYKRLQNMHNNEVIIDPLNDSKIVEIKTTKTFNKSKNNTYPYLDTLKYFNVTHKYMSNFYNDEKSLYYELENTNGFYEIINEKIYVEYYDDHFYKDDLIWCNFGEEFRLPRDAIKLKRYDEYATRNYAMNNMIYSEWDGDYYYEDDAVWSNYYESYIFNNDSIPYYIENASDLPFDLIYDNKEYMDYILIKEKNLLLFYNNEYMWFFRKTNEENFIKCKSLNSNGKKIVWAHKKWDKNKIFIMEDEYWLHDSSDEKFYSIENNIKLLGEKNNNN